MSNTNTNTRILAGLKKVVQHVTITYVDSQETDYIVYDSSDVATTLGKADSLNCKILDIKCSSNSIAGLVKLEFDATTDILAWTIPRNDSSMCFEKFSGLINNAGSGKTGDITLTTTGLAAGESITLVITVDPKYAS